MINKYAQLAEINIYCSVSDEENTSISASNKQLLTESTKVNWAIQNKYKLLN